MIQLCPLRPGQRPVERLVLLVRELDQRWHEPGGSRGQRKQDAPPEQIARVAEASATQQLSCTSARNRTATGPGDGGRQMASPMSPGVA